MFEVDLVTDAHARGHDAELLKRTLGPLQEGVALDVAFVLNGDVLLVALGGAGALEDDRVVDHQFYGDQRIDLVGLSAESDDGVAHGSQVHHCGHPGEVLHEHSLGGEGDLAGVLPGRLAVTVGCLGPTRERLDVRGVYLHAILVAQQIL